MWLKKAPLLALCMAVVSVSEALTCYKCTYVDGQELTRCADPFDETGSIKEICDENSYACMKRKTFVNGQVFVSRGCEKSIPSLADSSCETSGSLVTCHCKTDLCNSSPLTRSMSVPATVCLSLLTCVVYGIY